jgi:hypothetical protein
LFERSATIVAGRRWTAIGGETDLLRLFRDRGRCQAASFRPSVTFVEVTSVEQVRVARVRPELDLVAFLGVAGAVEHDDQPGLLRLRVQLLLQLRELFVLEPKMKGQVPQ